MEQLIVLGTGNAMATQYYNTCFALVHRDEFVLVDAGGGNGILTQIKKAGLDFTHLRHLIVTHEHCDHLLGVIWIIRKIGTLMKSGNYQGKLHIWCHAKLIDTICTLASLTLQQKFVELLGEDISLHSVEDGTTAPLLNWPVTFFNIHSTKALQYGFTLLLESGKRLTCLGDEPYNPLCAPWVAETDILLCEAFCLYQQRDAFKPYEKHHSTVREACELAQTLAVETLVLWHTEDKTYPQRQKLYEAEGKEYYNGNLWIPEDLDTLTLSEA